MSDTIRLPADVGQAFRALRKARGLTVVRVAELAGKSRDTLYRLEAGEDVSLGTFLAFLSSVGCALRIVEAGLPSLEEMTRRFADDDDD